jgi:hypothetical protein
MKAGKFEIFDKIKNSFKIRNRNQRRQRHSYCYNTIAATFDELSEPDKAFLLSKGLVYANRTTNDKLKNWLYNNLGNIYCFDKKNMKRLLLQKITRIQYKNHDTHKWF